jgi:putative FmdB family regulatory protein
MPLYTYQCPSCNEKDTKLVPMSHAESDFQCPVCHVSLHKIFDVSGTTFQLKGEGWFSKQGKY